MSQDPNSAAPGGTSTIPPGPTNYATPVVGTPSKDEQNMAMLCHLLGIFTWWLGPLIIWLIKKDSSPFVNEQGKEALNWEITATLGLVIGGATIWMLGLGALIWLATVILNIVFNIMAIMKVNQGQLYRYPFAIRLIK